MSIGRGGFVTSIQLHKLSNVWSGCLRPSFSSFCSRDTATNARYFKLGLGQRAPLKYTSDERRMSGSSSSLGLDVRGEVARASHGDLHQQKAVMRKRIEGVLKSMDETRIGEASAGITDRLLATPEMKAAHVVSIFLSMPREVGTSGILSELFRSDKKVYIPKVTGSSSEDMRMFPLESEAEVSSFPLSKWKIPEPTNETVQAREDGVYAGDLDLIVVPGMAFDSKCNRLGHGKGYYDCFFQRVDKSNAEKGHPPPVKMGVCFDEQIVETVPTSPSDVPLDFVLTPSRIFEHSSDDLR